MSIQPAQPARQLSLFEKALAGSHVVETVFTQRSSVKDNKPGLVGIPFIITKVTFQLPDEELNKDNDVKDYVSLEIQIAPEEFIAQNIKRKAVPYQGSVEGWVESYGYRPNDYLVLNDGSKGIRRQIVEALQNSGMIDIGPLTGTKQDFDRPWAEWVRFDQAEQHKQDGEPVDVPSFSKGSHGDDLAMPVLMGLRESRDPDAPTAHSSTFYLS